MKNALDRAFHDAILRWAGHPPRRLHRTGSSKCFDGAETRFAPQHKTPARFSNRPVREADIRMQMRPHRFYFPPMTIAQ